MLKARGGAPRKRKQEVPTASISVGAPKPATERGYGAKDRGKGPSARLARQNTVALSAKLETFPEDHDCKFWRPRAFHKVSLRSYRRAEAKQVFHVTTEDVRFYVIMIVCANIEKLLHLVTKSEQ